MRAPPARAAFPPVPGCPPRPRRGPARPLPPGRSPVRRQPGLAAVPAGFHGQSGTVASAHPTIDVAPGQARRCWIIQLLDDERTLKNVLEHHEEREEKGLLPELGLPAAT